MQLSVPWRYGQAKPFGSIPRINWAHPLAKGLVCYCYDAGGGVVVDLVSGNSGVYTQSGTPTAASIQSSKFGQGWFYPQQASATPGVAVVFPIGHRTDNYASAGAWSWSCGFVQTALNTSGLSGFFWSLGVPADTYWGLGVNTSSAPRMATDAGFYNFTTSRAVANNVFTTVTLAGSSPTLANGYYTDSSGYVQVNNGLAIPANGVSSAQQVVMGNANPATTTGSNKSFYNGFILYGAAWIGRQLSASEAMLLAADPWCLLIYPEDEIFAMLVGAAVVAALPSAPAESLPWILPGLGPNSRHISLLNAALPTQPIVQPVTGGTLPFMGVGG